MDYRYGTFSDEQMRQAALLMHNEIHRLLLYKDSQITELIFADDEEFFAHFERLLYRLIDVEDCIIDVVVLALYLENHLILYPLPHEPLLYITPLPE